jgi:cell wall assembly regulator SMI1
MRFENSRAPVTSEALSSAEAEIGLRFPLGLREHYLRSNGGVPDPYIFRRGAMTVAISECLPLRVDGRGLSAMEAYRSLIQERKILPPYLFPFAVDGGGNLFLVDCREDDGWVYVWWHDVPDNNLLDLRTGISEFWSHLQDT